MLRLGRSASILSLVFACAGCPGDDDSTEQPATADASTSTTAPASTTSSTTAPMPGSSSDSSSSGPAADGSSSTGTMPTGRGEGAQCDLFNQDCLPGLKCTLKLASALMLETACVEVQGNNTAGDPCEHQGFQSGVDDCDGTSFCLGIVSFSDGWEGTCKPLCIGSIDDPFCENANQVCGGGSLPICLERCDPLLQNCIGENEACYLNTVTNNFQCIALAETQVGLGELCSFGTACQPGLQCQDGGNVPDCAGNCCAEFCDVDETPNPCTLADQGVECIAVGAAQPEFQSVGVCIFP